MADLGAKAIIRQFQSHIRDKTFPCLGAHAALSQNVIRYYVADHITTSAHDVNILSFLYSFIDEIRQVRSHFYSAVILFKGPDHLTESDFETCFWNRLQALNELDARSHPYDSRVSSDIHSPGFSFSIKEEGFYIIGLHGQNSRNARRFPFPALVLNTHAQFQYLREQNQYDKMQQVIRKRDIRYSGSVNPMLADFGKASEVLQYTGKQYDSDWKCPLNIRHATASSKHNTST